jgi:hypothetical protein
MFAPRLWGGVLGALILVMQVGATPASIAQAQADSADLVSVYVDNDAAFNRLAAMDLALLAQMGAVDGGWVIAARVDAAQQAALTAAGFDVTVLEKGVPADAAGYYLLYGMPEDLTTLQKELPSGAALLVVEDRQALAKLDPTQIAEVEEFGVTALPVVPFAPAPVAEQAAARTLAPELVYSPTVQQMVNSLEQDTLVDYLAQLSGEAPTVINGSPYTLSTRYTWATEHINKATRFAYEYFNRLGLPVDYDYYYISGIERRNVIAEQVGVIQPNCIYLLTAHLDSRAANDSESMTFAPGADDNASGSAALMAIAEILRDYRFDCTLRYALFTGEEQGLYGSTDYAADVVRMGDNVRGVLNLDMLGYNTWNSAPTIELHTRPGNAGDLAIADLFRDAVAAYSQPLTPQIRQDNLRFSDHAPFWDRGFPALLAIEDWDDHTPNYHRTSDQLENLHIPYYTAFARAALATFAHMAGPLEDGLRGRVTQTAGGAALPNAQISAWMSGQTPVSTLSNLRGEYYLDLAVGTYTVKFSASGYQSETVSNVQIISGQTAVLDRALASCSTISGLAMSASTGSPDTGQSVTFQASASGGAQPVTYTWSFGDGGSASGAQTTHAFSTPGVYPVKVIANNICDYPLEVTRNLLVDVNGVFLPLLAR